MNGMTRLTLMGELRQVNNEIIDLSESVVDTDDTDELNRLVARLQGLAVRQRALMEQLGMKGGRGE